MSDYLADAFFKTPLDENDYRYETKIPYNNQYSNSNDNGRITKAKKKHHKKVHQSYYAVASGRKRGIFKTWNACERQVKGYSNARFKKFKTRQQAQQFIDLNSWTNFNQGLTDFEKRQYWPSANLKDSTDIRVYTDGGMRKTEKIGAYAFIIEDHGQQITAKRAYPKVTNQRMGLKAVLSFLKHGHNYTNQRITIVTDSKYIYNMFTQGWISAWEKQGWKLMTTGKPVKHQDIIKPMRKLIKDYPKIKFCWVKGHAHTAGNISVDELVNQAMNEYLGG